MSGIADETISSRHTRLRYQTVLASLLFYLASKYGVEEFKIPGFFEFEKQPSNEFLAFGVLLFTVFSAVSFAVQHYDENRFYPDDFDEFRNSLSKLKLYLEKGPQSITSRLSRFVSLGQRILSNTSDYSGPIEVGEEVGNELEDIRLAILPAQAFFADLKYRSDNYSRFIPDSFTKRQILSQMIAVASGQLIGVIPLWMESNTKNGVTVFAYDIKKLRDGISTSERLLESLRGSEMLIKPVRELVKRAKLKKRLNLVVLPFYIPLAVASTFVVLGIIEWCHD